MYELFGGFLVAYTLKLLKPSGASLVSLGILSSTTWCLNTSGPSTETAPERGVEVTGYPAIFKKIAQWCQPGTRLILDHDTIPYLKMKRNFIHTLFSGTPLFWGSGYQNNENINISNIYKHKLFTGHKWFLTSKQKGTLDYDTVSVVIFPIMFP